MAKETRTYALRREYLIQAVKKRRRKLKEMAVNLKGGKCELCGYSRCIAALDFHQLSDKSFSLSTKGLTRSWIKIKQEIDKCILVCANCHREIHAKKVKININNGRNEPVSVL